MSSKNAATKQKRQRDTEVVSSESAVQDTMVEKRRRIVPVVVAKSRAKWISPTSEPPKKHHVTAKPTCKKQLFSKVPKVDNHIKQSDLVVRHSSQIPDPVFVKMGKTLGKGVFTPRLSGGTTEDITLSDDNVRRMHRSALIVRKDWRLDYAVMDLYHDDMVYVPKNKDTMDVFFRVQHRSSEPSHVLYQPCSGLPRLVCIRELQPGEEVTFNYNLTPDNCEEETYESSDPEDLGASFSLGTQVRVLHVLL